MNEGLSVGVYLLLGAWIEGIRVAVADKTHSYPNSYTMTTPVTQARHFYISTYTCSGPFDRSLDLGV